MLIVYPAYYVSCSDEAFLSSRNFRKSALNPAFSLPDFRLKKKLNSMRKHSSSLAAACQNTWHFYAGRTWLSCASSHWATKSPARDSAIEARIRQSRIDQSPASRCLCWIRAWSVVTRMFGESVGLPRTGRGEISVEVTTPGGLLVITGRFVHLPWQAKVAHNVANCSRRTVRGSKIIIDSHL